MHRIEDRRRVWGIPVTLALAVVAACGQEGEGLGASGIQLFEGAVELEIGEATGDDAYLFSSIGSIVEDRWGRIVVSDIQLNEIRVFEPDGSFAFRLGGYGEGPGELNGPCCMRFGPDGLLWVRDVVRYSVFRLDSAGAEFERVVQSPHLGSVGLVAPFVVGEGELISVGPVAMDDGPPMSHSRVHVHADGTRDTVILADAERQATGRTTVIREVSGFQAQIYVYQPLGPRWTHAHAANGAWAEAVTSEYLVNLHQSDGTALQIAGAAGDGPELTASEREWAQSWIDRDLERLDRASHPFGIPERKPPLSGLFFDNAGRLWVRKARVGGAEMSEADVWDGPNLAARYRWPARVSADDHSLVTESMLYGTTTDSLGVPRVARVRFRPVG